MDERLESLEQQMQGVVDRLIRVESRLDGLEGTSAAVAASGEPGVAAEDVPPPVLAEGSLSSIATHLGRTLLIFGGAYFLRALTDFEFLPPAAGVLLGAAYAILWLLMADRSGAREGQHATAVFYGIASVLLGMPILVETTTRFQLLTGAQAAIALAIFCALVLAVAARRNLQSLAWLATLSGLPTALILLRTTHEAIPFATVLVLLGLASLWIVYLKHWKVLHWLGALGADSAVAIAALLGTTDQWTVGPITAYLLGLTLLVGYSSSFAVRSHIQRRTMGAFEVVQGLFVIGIALWTAGLASPVAEGMSTSVLGFLMLVMGVGSYALSFTPDTRTVRGRNFFFYTTVGLILIVGGSSLVLTPGKAAAAWSLLAVLMAIFSGRYSRVTLSLQCTLLLLAAGVASGIFATGFEALTSAGAEVWPTVGVWHLIVAGATVACLFIPVAQRSERWGNLAGLPQLIVLALSVWEVGGLMVAYLAPAIAGVPGPDADLGALAALRTLILTASAVTLSLSSRHPRWPEARWLAYPVLGIVGFKLIFEDFPNGRPLTLFAALALAGGALILVARLLRQDRVRQTES